MKLKINHVAGYDGIIHIKTDEDGTPLEKFWRNRIKDSKLDNCVEIIKPKTEKAK